MHGRSRRKEYSAELITRGLPPLKTRIGLNTGPAVAAYIGLPGERFYYTALGDTVNLASRLEGANKAYGTSIMIGPQTYEEAKHAVLARELDLVRVKGKKIPVHVYELIGRIEEPFPRQREIKRRYEAALVKFRARDFEGAQKDFQSLIDEFDDPPSKTYLKYSEERIKEPPPPDWDGSNELHEK
jgi:adenylate cyclase